MPAHCLPYLHKHTGVHHEPYPTRIPATTGCRTDPGHPATQSGHGTQPLRHPGPLASPAQWLPGLCRGAWQGAPHWLALAIGQANACQYCLSAHTLLAGKAGFSAQEIRAARLGQASAPLDHALLQLATALVSQRGVISDEQLASARDAGIDDEQLLEVLGQVVVNTLTNYGNHLAATKIDFPPVTLTP